MTHMSSLGNLGYSALQYTRSRIDIATSGSLCWHPALVFRYKKQKAIFWGAVAPHLAGNALKQYSTTADIKGCRCCTTLKAAHLTYVYLAGHNGIEDSV